MDADHYIKAILNAVSEEDKLKLWAEATKDLDWEDETQRDAVKALHAACAQEIISAVRSREDRQKMERV